MPSRILKNNVLSVALGSLVLAASSMLVSGADDSWTLSSGSGFADQMIADPVMPNLPDDTAGPDVVLPQFNAAITASAITVPGANPFTPVITNAAMIAPVAPASTNPFAIAPAPVTGPTTTTVSTLQPLTLPPTTPAVDTPLTTPAGKRVDETALRYYAQQRDLPRVGAEIRRLKALYPGWEPPADLFNPVSTVDEQPLWDLFRTGQLTTERTKLAELKAANPTWTPSTDLMSKLEDAEAREAIRIAYNAANWSQVVAVAQSRNSLLVCPQIESLWQLGEAFARQRDYAHAFDIYKYILVNCTDATERLSTVQKAARLLPQQGIDSLVLLGKPLADGTSEFESIGFSGLRTQLNEAVRDDMDADPIDPNALERFAAYVRATRLPSDIGLIGWYYYGLDEYKAAYAWFAAGARISKDPKFLEGELLALRGGEQTNAALKLASAVQGRTPELTKEYVEIVAAILTDPETETVFTDAQMKGFQDIVMKNKSALGAQAIGWTYIASNDLATASTWFSSSMGWGVTEGGVIGKAVVASRLKQYATLSALKSQYTAKYPGLSKFRIYTVKVKKSSYSKPKKVTQSSIDCNDRKPFGLFFSLSCR